MKDIKLEVRTDIDTCSCCGRTDLKRVISVTVDGEHVGDFGVVCAARRIPAAETRIKKAFQEFDRAELAAHTVEADKAILIVETQAARNGWTIADALARFLAYKPAARDLLVWRYQYDRFSLSLAMRDAIAAL